MKQNSSKKFLRGIRNILQIKLWSRNLKKTKYQGSYYQEIFLTFFGYGRNFGNRHQKKKKSPITKQKLLHWRDNVNRSYIKQNGGWRWFTSIEDCVKFEIEKFEEFPRLCKKKTTSNRPKLTEEWTKTWEMENGSKNNYIDISEDKTKIIWTLQETKQRNNK